MKLTLPKQANEPLRIGVMKQSKNSVMTRNMVLKQSVIKSVENIVNEYGKVECNYTIGKPESDGYYLCRLQFSRFPIVLSYKANSQTWLRENGETFTDEAVLGYIHINLTPTTIELE